MSRHRMAMAMTAVITLLGLLALMSVAPARAATSRPAPGGPLALISGSGSSWAAIAVNNWVSNIASQGVQVVYTASGSASGRTDFANNTVDFAVSDIGYQGIDPGTGAIDKSNRPYAYLPITGGGTAFPYNLVVNGQKVTNLRLSGLTLAKIFTGKITNWNDPAITTDDNGHALPSLPITTVVHSEGSGTTAMFSRYLAKMFPSLWGPFNNGQNVMVEYWPQGGPNQRAQSGSSQVMNYIAAPGNNGAIGVDEYAYARQAGFPVAAIENQAGYFVLPSMYNDAVALTTAVINTDPTSPDYLLQNLDNVYTNSDPRAYPLSSYSYTVMPTSATDPRMQATGGQFPSKWQSLADFLYYSICEGQTSIGQLGYSALPINLVEAGFQQIDKIKTAAPQVDITQQNVSTCHNPTFVAGNPNANYLAQIAPMPAACAKVGQGPCGGTTNANAGGGTSGTGGGGSGGTGGSGATAGAGASPSVSYSVNPITGQTVPVLVGGGGTGGTAGAAANGLAAAPASATLASNPDDPVSGLILGILAALLLLGALIAPPLLSGQWSQRPGRRP